MRQAPVLSGFTLTDRRLETGEVSVGELGQGFGGLHQHPQGDLGRHAGAGPHRVTEGVGTTYKASQVGAERAGRRLSQDRVQLAAEQVVVAGRQIALQHQEIEQWLQVRLGALQARPQGQGGPDLWVWETGEEDPRPVVKSLVANTSGLQPLEVVVVDGLLSATASRKLFLRGPSGTHGCVSRARYQWPHRGPPWQRAPSGPPPGTLAGASGVIGGP